MTLLLKMINSNLMSKVKQEFYHPQVVNIVFATSLQITYTITFQTFKNVFSPYLISAPVA